MEDKIEVKSLKVSTGKKYNHNPFVSGGVLKIDKGKRQIIAGSTKKVLVDTDTGETEGIAMLHKYHEVDKTQFVKLFISEVSALFDLSKSGLKVFGYVLSALRINVDEVYIDIQELKKYCGYKQKNQVYKGLAELMSCKIIAMSNKSSIWYINPNIIFNGDRIVFAKEYRIKKSNEIPTQQTFTLPEMNDTNGEEVQGNSKSE